LLALDGQGSLVTQAAQALSDLSMTHAPGTYLGAEDDLLERLSVSRPTLRQAAKIVENDRLISVRRGVKGGFYAERPNAADAITSLARYLRLNGATIADVFAVTRLISEEAGALAAANADVDARQRIQMFRGAIDEHNTPRAIVRAETELARLIAEMSGNPALELVMEIGYTFGMDERGVHFYAEEADRERTRILQRGLCDAILAGDIEIARLMMRRRSALVAEWIDRDLGAAA
jgi:GntR family transcriptional regulator, transcriptional repressor for pyruvate dehydrogenase complex